MTSRSTAIYQWVSPVCFAGVVGMVWLGSDGSEPILRGWAGVMFWAMCGALAAMGCAATVLGVMAARQHLHVARARIQRQRDAGTCASRPVPYRRGEFRS